MKTKEISETIAQVAIVKSLFYIDNESKLITQDSDFVLVPFRTKVVSTNVDYKQVKVFIERFINGYDTDFYAKGGKTCIECKYNPFDKTLSLRLCSVFNKESPYIEHFEGMRGLKRIKL